MSDYKAEYVISLKDLYSKVAGDMDRSTRRLEGRIDSANASAERLGKTAKRVGGMLVAAFSIAAIRSFSQEAEEAALSMERMNQQFRFSMGSAEDGAREYEHARQVAYDLGLDLERTAGSYAKFAAAAKGTALEGEGARKVFDAVSVASGVMRLSGEQTEGAMRALEQMMSKGKVQAEELRGQLGERLPGAFKMAADAMGMTTAQLNKFMEDGNLISDEFLPRFADQLMKNYGGAIDQVTDLASTKLARQKIEIFELTSQIGQQLVPVMYAFRQAQLAVLKVISGAIKFYQDHKNVIKGIAVFVGTLTAAYYINAAAQAFMALRAGQLTVALWAQAAANGALLTSIRMIGVALNTALGPIGWVSLAISALVGIVTWAWNTFEGFRGVVYGVWEAVKQTFSNIYEFFKRYFSPVIEAIAAMKDGRWGDAAKAAGVALLRTSPLTGPFALAAEAYKERGNLTKGVADAYRKGNKEGRESMIKEETPKAGSAFDIEGAGAGGLGDASSPLSAATKSSKVEASKPTNIYVNIDTLGEVSVHTNNVMQSATEIKRMVQETLIAAVNDAQTVMR